MELVEVAAGWFWMGWEEGHPGERPRHRVWLDRFAIGPRPRHQRRVRGLSRGGRCGSPALVERFALQRSATARGRGQLVRSGAVLRLALQQPRRAPSLAYRGRVGEGSARRGSTTLAFPGAANSPPPDASTAPLASRKVRRTRWGWSRSPASATNGASTGRDPGYYAVSPERNPTGPSHGSRRVSRGGAWRHQDPWSPVAHRSSLPPDLRYSDYGFRVVRVPGS
jgi:hypothetical protein